MAVALDVSSESHTGTTGSTSEASFTWTHTPSGTPKGIVVFVGVSDGSGTPHTRFADRATSVTYGGVALDELDIYAFDNAGEASMVQAFFLGVASEIAGRANNSVVVNRNNNAKTMYAVAYTVTATKDVWISNHVRVEGDGTYAEQAVDDGSFSGAGNSLRLAFTFTGFNDPTLLAAGSNSTIDQSVDVGNFGWRSAHETTVGTGSRSVGFSSGTTDDRAGIMLAVSERPTAQTVEHQLTTKSHADGLESTSEASFSWTHQGPHRRLGAVVVIVQTRANATNDTGVTYGGVSMSLLSSYTAQDTAGEPATERLYYLKGSAAGTGDKTVTVSRTNNSNPMMAYAITAMADADLEVTGAVLLQGDGTIAEQSVSDASNRGNSYRYTAGYHGYSAPTTFGANTRRLELHDFTLSGGGVGGELLPGSGSRSVGESNGTSDDRALTHWALQYIVNGSSALTDQHDSTSATGSVTASVTGTAALTDKHDTTAATGVETIAGTAALTDKHDTMAASGYTDAIGTAALTDQHDSTSATGAEALTGASALTDKPDTSAATGTERFVGTSALTDQHDSMAASGYTDITGEAALTDRPDSTHAVGTFGDAVNGSADLTDKHDSTSASGIVTDQIVITGTAALVDKRDRMEAVGTGGEVVVVPDAGGAGAKSRRQTPYSDYTVADWNRDALILLLMASQPVSMHA